MLSVADILLSEELQQQGWSPFSPTGVSTKGEWKIAIDTSNWILISTSRNPCLRGIALPEADEIAMAQAVSLIEHLCAIDDERFRLRDALAQILDHPGADPAVRAMAEDALAQCYHRWLKSRGVPENEAGKEWHCPVCKQTKRER